METSETSHTTARRILLTLAIALLLTSGIVASYILADLLSTPLNIASHAFLYLTSGLAVLVAGGFLASTVMLIYLGVREYGGGLLKTPFYRPQILKHACLLAVTGPAGLRGLDRIIHHTHITWNLLLDPEVIVLASLYYFGVLVTSLWLNGVWFSTSFADHRTAWRRVVVGCVGFEAFLVVGLFVLYWFGGR